MDEEVETRFKETFDAIAAHFSEIFVKMFGGGQAKLELTDPEHLLTTGVDIKAQPPGAYDTSFEFAKAEMSDMPIDSIRTQLKLLKQGLAEIGNVNLNAIEEYAEVKERYDFLTQQQTDLIDA
ncbi:hypothetical protein H7R52_12700 [Weissella confusa]|uniref:Uncharacterized protein n=1 Tax=Weissella confusa TaxID=1583 RepID=A0A923NH17_WEICO|nr:hypothetical protein [Weissella confusa]